MATPPTDPRTDPSPRALLESRPSLRMDARDGLLFEGVPLHVVAAIAGTPCWVTGAGTLRRRAAALRSAFAARNLPARFHFAMKSQDHQATLAILRESGFGVDIVSGGEMARALHAGIAPAEIVFSGVGKTDGELREAVAREIGQINVESAEELRRLDEIAASLGRVAPVALRVNPDVDAHTHDKISTGRATDKFGIARRDVAALYAEAAAMAHIRPIGLAVHLGSQILDAAPFRAGYEVIAGLVRDIRASGHEVGTVDCGGGLGIRYRDEIAPSPEMLAGVIAATLGNLGVKLSVEPGRWLSGPSGLLLSRVIETKSGNGTAPDFLIIDAAMNDLARPALYDSWHGILPLSPAAFHQKLRRRDVAGPVCESSDVLARSRPLPETLGRGDLVAVLDTGAYGSVMSSTYNSRPLAAQVMVDNGRWSVIRRRQTIEELIAAETVPPWFATAPAPESEPKPEPEPEHA